jgi:hypothetical protein
VVKYRIKVDTILKIVSFYSCTESFFMILGNKGSEYLLQVLLVLTLLVEVSLVHMM